MRTLAVSRSFVVSTVLGLGLGLACDAESGDGGGGDENTEIISRVELAFTPADAGAPIVVAFTDPDGDGGVSGTAEPIVLTAGTDYELTIRVLNDLVDPPVEITDEIRAEAEDHLFLVAGEGVRGPASTSGDALVTHAYDDVESDYTDDLEGDDLPVGLANTITANVAGDSELRLLLRHLPPLNGTPQKRAGLPEAFAAGDALPGEVDVDVRFDLQVM